MYYVKTPTSTDEYSTIEEANEIAQTHPLSMIYEEDIPLFGYVDGDKENPKKIHGYDITRILRPYGSHTTGSLSYVLCHTFEKLIGLWSNDEFSDKESRDSIIRYLDINAHKELALALDRIKNLDK